MSTSFGFPNYLSEGEQAAVSTFIKHFAPDAFVRRDYGVIDSSYWNRLRVLLGRTKAQITVDNLTIAHLALVEEDRALAREAARKQQVFADVEAALASIPDFNAGDEYNVKAAETFFNQNPTATAQDCLPAIDLHPAPAHCYSGPKIRDRVAVLHQYGSAA